MKNLIACLVAASTACAHAPGAGPASAPAADQDRAAAAALQERADALEETLSALGVESKAPDCSRACGLVDQICDLGQRICTISGRHVGDEDLANRCAAATVRCQRSRDRAASRCTCASP
ncbi:MAG TPA: hypothetical protein VI356_07320 [Myxococcales bacterium]